MNRQSGYGRHQASWEHKKNAHAECGCHATGQENCPRELGLSDKDKLKHEKMLRRRFRKKESDFGKILQATN